MSSLRDKIDLKGISVGSIHRATGVFKADVSHFVNGRKNRCPKKSKSILRSYFISIGLLPAPKPQPRCICDRCGKQHVQSKQPRSVSQLQSAAEKLETSLHA